MEIVDDLVDQLMKKMVHHCSERCEREGSGANGTKIKKCRVPYNRPSPSCYYEECKWSSMHVTAIEILSRYGVERTVIKGAYKYPASHQKARYTPQIPEKTWCFQSNQNILACDNKGNEHSYLMWYSLKGEQLAFLVNEKIAKITEKNGRKDVQDQFYSTSR